MSTDLAQAFAEANGLEPGDDTPAPWRRTWRPVDLTDVLTGQYVPPTPTVGPRNDGPHMFYPGRVHSIASESEAGKTWVALLAVLRELNNGNACCYVDFEDDEGGVVGRLLALGADRDAVRARFAYVRPDEAIGAAGNREDLADVLTTLKPTLVVVDGITEAMALHGLELKDNGDVARFGTMLLRWIAGHGPAVVALDHVVKDREGRGRYAIGAVHKLNAIDGAAYVLENRTPFGVGLTGRSTVYVTKDRPGQVRRHALPARERLHWFADLVLVSHDETFVEASLEPPAERGGDDFRPTVLMARIAAALDQHGPLAARKIETVVTGKAVSIRQALVYLQLAGYVSDATPHELLRPYQPEDIQ